MIEFRYAGRQRTVEQPSAHHGPSIVTALAAADIGYIDKPMSFPWELVTTSITCPLVIDVTKCSGEQLIGLRPALSCLTPSDSLVNSDEVQRASTQRLARILGVRFDAPDAGSIAELHRLKRVDLEERMVLERLRNERVTVVVDIADVLSGAISGADLEGSTRVESIAVRVPGAVIRSSREGVTGHASQLRRALASGELDGVWGIRATPGDPVDRGVLVFAGRDDDGSV